MLAAMTPLNFDIPVRLPPRLDSARAFALIKAAFGTTRRRQPRVRPPDGLRTKAEAAAKLGCSIKTLNAHVDAGELRYVVIGHGKKRPRMRFADADLDEFIANQTRKDTPCPSTASRARHTSTSNSESVVIAFTAAPKPPPGAKPKK
jgi:hypothetical protein